jgi:hypothetical protein
VKFKPLHSLRIAVSLVLGGITSGAVVLGASKLPSGSILNTIADAASIPALAISAIFYPEGIHTGGGAVHWVVVYMGSGICFYTLMWFVILSLLNRRGKSSNP